jgi:hypothetical protein
MLERVREDYTICYHVHAHKALKPVGEGRYTTGQKHLGT